MKLKELKSKKGKSASVLSLKEKVLGSKKAKQEPAVVKDPDTNKLVTDVDEIKRVSLKYCVDLLTNRKPKPEERKEWRNSLKMMLNSLKNCLMNVSIY